MYTRHPHSTPHLSFYTLNSFIPHLVSQTSTYSLFQITLSFFMPLPIPRSVPHPWVTPHTLLQGSLFTPSLISYLRASVPPSFSPHAISVPRHLLTQRLIPHLRAYPQTSSFIPLISHHFHASSLIPFSPHTSPTPPSQHPLYPHLTSNIPGATKFRSVSPRCPPQLLLGHSGRFYDRLPHTTTDNIHFLAGNLSSRMTGRTQSLIYNVALF